MVAYEEPPQNSPTHQNSSNSQKPPSSPSRNPGSVHESSPGSPPRGRSRASTLQNARHWRYPLYVRPSSEIVNHRLRARRAAELTYGDWEQVNSLNFAVFRLLTRALEKEPRTPASSQEIPDEREIYEARFALDRARAAQLTIEAQELFLLRRMQEEQLSLRSLEDEVEDVRTRWEDALGQVGFIRRSLRVRGISPHPQTAKNLMDPASSSNQLRSAAFNSLSDNETVPEQLSYLPRPRSVSPPISPTLSPARPLSFRVFPSEQELGREAVENQTSHPGAGAQALATPACT